MLRASGGFLTSDLGEWQKVKFWLAIETLIGMIYRVKLLFLCQICGVVCKGTEEKHDEWGFASQSSSIIEVMY